MLSNSANFYSTGPWSNFGRKGQGEHLKAAPPGVGSQMLTNNRIGWKDLPETNTLAYLATSSVTKQKVMYH
jgi:hypothetical protein